MSNNSFIEIFLAANDNYAQHLGVTIASILTNASPNDRLNFNIMCNSLLPENQEKILALKQIKNCKIQFIFMDYLENLEDFFMYQEKHILD